MAVVGRAFLRHAGLLQHMNVNCDAEEHEKIGEMALRCRAEQSGRGQADDSVWGIGRCRETPSGEKRCPNEKYGSI